MRFASGTRDHITMALEAVFAYDDRSNLLICIHVGLLILSSETNQLLTFWSNKCFEVFDLTFAKLKLPYIFMFLTSKRCVRFKPYIPKPLYQVKAIIILIQPVGQFSVNLDWSSDCSRFWEESDLAFVCFSLFPDTLRPVSFHLPKNKREMYWYPFCTLIVWPNKIILTIINIIIYYLLLRIISVVTLFFFYTNPKFVLGFYK